MAVSVDGSAPLVPFNLPGRSAVSGAEQPEDFAYLYQLTAGADLDEQPLAASDKAAGEEDEASDKKLADEQAAAALLLFLFSQMMPSTPPPADIGADQGEQATDTAMDENNRALSLDTDPVPDELPQDDNPLERSIKSSTDPFEKNTDENKQAGQDLAVPPVKTPSAAATAEQPVRLEGKRRAAPLSENVAVPRALLQSSHDPLTARPSAQAQALPLQNGQFCEMLGQRVMWLSSQNLQAAQIELSPKELGTLQVRVALAEGAAEVQLASQHAEVRGVLEGQLHRLQAMLENQGLPAPRLEVLDASFSQHKEQSSKQSSRPASKQGDKLKTQDSVSLLPASHQNLIDYYA